MNPADLLVAAVIVTIVASAVLVLVRDKRSGKKCCGCRSCCREPQIVSISDESENKR